MRQLIILPLCAFLFVSCLSQTKIIETSDRYKKVENVKLIQYLRAKSADRDAGTGVWQEYPVACTYFFEGSEDGKSSIIIEVKMETPVSTDPMDSVMFLNLDGERFRMVADNYKSRQFILSSEAKNTIVESKSENGKEEKVIQSVVLNNNYQLMVQRFVIPESLWISIANTEKMEIRIYLGKEGFDISLNQAQVKRMQMFFQLSICKRDDKIPPFPEGYKKW
jgi:hypothetical protein